MTTKPTTPSRKKFVVLHQGNTDAVRISPRGSEYYGNMIRHFRELLDITQRQLAEMIDVSRTTVVQWENGTSKPDLDKLTQLCSVLNTSADSILGISDVIEQPSQSDLLRNRLYHSLSMRDQHVIDVLLNTLHENSYLAFKSNFDKDFGHTVCSTLKVCAGSGIELLDGRQPLKILIRMTPLSRRCDEVIKLTGDSMLPDYSNGDRVMVEHCPTLSEGDIGIFVVNGEGMIKEYHHDHLHPLNPEYPDIFFHENDDIRCVGLVLGKLTDDLLPTRDEQYMIDEILEERRKNR